MDFVKKVGRQVNRKLYGLDSMTEMVLEKQREKANTSPIVETMKYNFMRDGNFLHPPGLPRVASPS